MKKTKTQKGITLIALIITIIVLLILAVVAIGAVQNDGIINHAKNAKEEYQAAQVNENTTLQGYLDMLDDTTTIKTSDIQNKVLSTTKNTEVKDAYGNKIVVPAGFKITADASLVTEGIVIEDCTETGTKGSQFVWIPVGTIYGDAEHTAEKTKTITLGRYEFNDDATYYASTNTDYEEKQKGDTTAQNAIAKDIEAFKTSATTNGGYYIGRYEAGVGNGVLDISDMHEGDAPNDNWTGYQTAEGTDPQLVCKSGATVWNYVTQKKAAELSGNMYNSGAFTSDLINSYAWDTAIMFIQTFGNSTYSQTDGESSVSTDEPQETGENILSATGEIDKQLNIYDMAGNCFEWSTESSENEWYDCVTRGGFFKYNPTSDRMKHYIICPHGGFGNAIGMDSFRPILYI